jgi:hypothetical protein
MRSMHSEWPQPGHGAKAAGLIEGREELANREPIEAALRIGLALAARGDVLQRQLPRQRRALAGIRPAIPSAALGMNTTAAGGETRSRYAPEAMAARVECRSSDQGRSHTNHEPSRLRHS